MCKVGLYSWVYPICTAHVQMFFSSIFWQQFTPQCMRIPALNGHTISSINTDMLLMVKYVGKMATIAWGHLLRVQCPQFSSFPVANTYKMKIKTNREENDEFFIVYYDNNMKLHSVAFRWHTDTSNFTVVQFSRKKALHHWGKHTFVWTLRYMLS